jgi:hypothetical protein
MGLDLSVGPYSFFLPGETRELIYSYTMSWVEGGGMGEAPGEEAVFSGSTRGKEGKGGEDERIGGTWGGRGDRVREDHKQGGGERVLKGGGKG